MQHLDLVILAKLQPHAQQLARSVVAWPPGVRRRRMRDVQLSLWRAAYDQGLTRFAVPPLLVSIFCRALWLVICYLVEQIGQEADD